MSTEASEKTVTTKAKVSPRLSVGMPSIALAVTIMLVLFGGIIYTTTTSTKADIANKRAAFENVLNMSSAELESKTVTELNGYRKDIVVAGHYSPALGNITGYHEAAVERELLRIHELIMKKTDH